MRTLEVRKTPVGLILGTVTSIPEGIDCGLLCTRDDATYPDGTVVTLVAQSILGASFFRWTGDCSGDANTCFVTMDDDKTVFAHFVPLRPSPVGDEPGMASSVRLRSRLSIPAGRGEVTSGGRTTSVGGGAETEIVLDSRTGDLAVEGWVREGAGEGVWRFRFGAGATRGWTIQNVLAGEPVTLTPDAVVFRVRGRLPQRVAFVLRLRREEESLPPR